MSQEKPLLLLFDGHALVHRAFHALERERQRFTVSKTGELVNAVYGFASMVLKVLSDFKPAYIAIAFDLPTPTFRHKKFEAYKAQRPPAPEELRGQFQRVRQLVEAFRIPIFELPGYEADDVLGALSRQAEARGLEAVIVTGDADTMQLVSPGVRVLYPRPGGGSFGDTVLFDEQAVQQKYGVLPQRMPDRKALEGDPSDNIPSIPGVGEKTALRLLQQFGSLEGIYSHLEEVSPPKLRETLRQNQEVAIRNKELATIVTDLPLELDLQACAVTAYDRSRVVELFRELEFASLLARLPESGELRGAPAGGETKTKPQGDYRLVNTEETLSQLLSRLDAATSLAVDTETTGREVGLAELVGISLSPTAGEAYYIPVGHQGLEAQPQLPLPLVLERLTPFLTRETLPKIAHNAKYDMRVLGNYGVSVRPLAFDTMIAAHLLGERALGLKALAFNRLAIEMTPITDLIGTGSKQISMAQVLIPRAGEYACADADLTGRLKEVLERELRAQELWSLFAQVEMPLVPVLLRMEQSGVALDMDLLRHLSQTLGQDMARLEKEIYDNVGHQFNINSPQQLATVLYDELRLPSGRRTKSGRSTEAAVLEELRGVHPVIGLILDYRQLAKLKSTYLDALPALISPRTGRVHTTFNQTGTTTGRLSSSDPNLQNIPVRGDLGRKIRQAIIAPPGRLLLGADYSQIDLRVLAHLSQDPGLVEAFRRDEDIHRATASQVFEVPLEKVTPDMRRVAKTINFGVIYGMSGYGLEQATELSREESTRFIQAYFERYPGIRQYVEATKEKARQLGYVETLLKRRRYIPEINSPNRQIREAAERMAINMPVQGTSADIIKVAMIDIQREMDKKGLKSLMLLQVHDELVFEVLPEEMAEMKGLVAELMPRALELSVPVKVDIKSGHNWAEME